LVVLLANQRDNAAVLRTEASQMITLQERIEYFSNNSALILTQLNELNRLQEQIRRARAAALESVKPKSLLSERAGRALRRRQSKR
jgi:hypothetical protein